MCKALEDLYQHGKDDKLREQVKKKLAKKCSAEQMAEALEESVETIQQIIQNIQQKCLLYLRPIFPTKFSWRHSYLALKYFVEKFDIGISYSGSNL